jgi:PucR family transcriptional regulator, purine catabolism regulatory protein
MTGGGTGTGGGRSGRSTVPSLARAQSLQEVLATPILAGARVLAGAGGLDRPVERLNVMEVPDILPWVKPREFLLTTGYPLRGHPGSLPTLVAGLDDAGVAGLGIKLGRYLDELPPGVLEVAEARGFPLVQLPEGVSFDEVLNEVLTGILHRQAQELARSERIHRAFLQLVLRGQGVTEIARDLADLLDGPAAVVGLDGEVLASARLEEVDRFAGAPPQRLVVDRDGRGVRTGDAHLEAVAVPILAGPREHGHVVALATRGARTDDLLALENAATVAALALTQRMEVQAVESKYQTDLMHDLLRHVEDVHDVRRRAAGFGWELDRRTIAIVLRVDDPPPAPVVPDEVTRRAPLSAALRQPVLDRDPRAAIVRFSHEVVILTAAFDDPGGREDARAFVRGLARRAAEAVRGPVSAGLSRPVQDPREIAGAYDQAARAVAIGRRIHGRGAVAHFDDLGAYRILSLVEDRTELQGFAEETLGELAGPTEAAADLRRTLEVLLEAGGNVAEAARRLHFHYNTLRYRIDKLESIVGPFTVDARVRLDVQLALLIVAMRELDHRP